MRRVAQLTRRLLVPQEEGAGGEGVRESDVASAEGASAPRATARPRQNATTTCAFMDGVVCAGASADVEMQNPVSDTAES